MRGNMELKSSLCKLFPRHVSSGTELARLLATMTNQKRYLLCLLSLQWQHLRRQPGRREKRVVFAPGKEQQWPHPAQNSYPHLKKGSLSSLLPQEIITHSRGAPACCAFGRNRIQMYPKFFFVTIAMSGISSYCKRSSRMWGENNVYLAWPIIEVSSSLPTRNL